MAIYRFLGSKVDKSFMSRLEEEKICFDTSQVFVRFKADQVKGPKIFISSNRRISRGRLIQTEKRLIAVVGGYKLIDIGKNNELFSKILIDKSTNQRIQLLFSLEDFQSGYSGRISLSFPTKKASGRFE